MKRPRISDEVVIVFWLLFSLGMVLSAVAAFTYYLVAP